MSRWRHKYRCSLNVILGLLSLPVYGQFEGLPIPSTNTTWEYANGVMICSQLLEAVTERCHAVGTNLVPVPQVVQTFVCSLGYTNGSYVVTNNIVVTNPPPTVTNIVVTTNSFLVTTNITTTNCVGPFTYINITGGSSTAYPPVTASFLGTIDAKLQTLLPYFVATNSYTTSFNTWFDRTNSLGLYVTNYPMLSMVLVCSNNTIGHIATVSTDTWGNVVGGSAFFTRQTPVTNNWTLAELVYDRIANSFTASNSGSSYVNGSYFWVPPQSWYTNGTSVLLYSDEGYGAGWYISTDDGLYYRTNSSAETPVGSNYIDTATSVTNAMCFDWNTNLYWQFRNIATFSTNYYDASVKPRMIYRNSNGTNPATSFPSLTVSVKGMVINQPGNELVPLETSYSISASNTVLADLWYSIRSIDTASPVDGLVTGAFLAVQYPSYTLYGGTPYRLDRTYVNERVIALKDMVWTVNQAWLWTNSLAGVGSNLVDNISTTATAYAYSYGSNTEASAVAWTNAQAHSPDYLGALSWWTMLFGDEDIPVMSPPWFDWLVIPHWTASEGIDDYVPTNGLPQWSFLVESAMNCMNEASFEHSYYKRVNTGDPLEYLMEYVSGSNYYVGTLLDQRSYEQQNALVKSQIEVYTNITTNLSHLAEWYVYRVNAPAAPVTYFERSAVNSNTVNTSSYYIIPSNTIPTITNAHVTHTEAGLSEFWTGSSYYGTSTVSGVQPMIIDWGYLSLTNYYTNTTMVSEALPIVVADFTLTDNGNGDYYMNMTPSDYANPSVFYPSNSVMFWGVLTNICTLKVRAATNLSEVIAFTSTNSGPWKLDGTFYFDPSQSDVPTWNGATGTLRYILYNKWLNPTKHISGDGVPVPPPWTEVVTQTVMFSSEVYWYSLEGVTNGMPVTNTPPPYIAPNPVPTVPWLIADSVSSVVTNTLVTNAVETVYYTNWYIQVKSTNYSDSYALYSNDTYTITNVLEYTITTTNWFADQVLWNGKWDYEFYDAGGYYLAQQATNSSLASNVIVNAIDTLMKWNVTGGLRRY